MNDGDYRDILIKENISRIKNKIIILSGKGGVGKSTVAVNLAYGFAIKGFKTGILDIDLHGPSVAKMIGIESVVLEKNMEDGRYLPYKVLENLYALSLAFFLKKSDEPIVWRGPLKMGAIKQFLSDIYWPELDILIIDSPPGTGDEPLSMIQLINNIDGAVIVTTPQDISHLDVSKSVNFCKMLNLKIFGIVENMAYFICPHCTQKINIFEGEAAKKLKEVYGVEILGQLPIDTDISRSSDNGRPYIYDFGKKEGAQIFEKIVENLIHKIKR